jgi:dedA family protein
VDIISWIAGLAGTVSDAGALLAALGPWVLVGMAVIVFIESGVLFPFLPGDSLLVTAAVLHGSLGLGLWQIVSVCVVAAIAGDQAGYWLGSRFGRRLFKDDARILRTDRLEAAEAFFTRHGPLALVLGRFVPVVRTYAPFAAGTARMPYRHFVTWNIIGAIAWVGSMTAIGVLLSGIPGIADSIEGVVLVIIAISMLPVIIPAARRRWSMRRRPAAGLR